MIHYMANNFIAMYNIESVLQKNVFETIDYPINVMWLYYEMHICLDPSGQ